jgi:hypothetical protein
MICFNYFQPQGARCITLAAAARRIGFSVVKKLKIGRLKDRVIKNDI